VSGSQVSFPVPYGVWRVCAYKSTGTVNSGIAKTTATWNAPGPPYPTGRPVVVTTPTTTGSYVPRLSTELSITNTGPPSVVATC
jgi:hypothetical protein